MILIVSEDEKEFIGNVKEYLQSNTSKAIINLSQGMAISFPGLEIDLYHREIYRNGNIIELTDIEFRILLFLAQQPGRVFTYQQIYEGVWGEEYAHEKGNVMSHIHHIRQKLESDEGSFDYIENIRGVGYKFKKPMTDSS